MGRFLSACTERSRSVDPLAASGGQDRLSPYAAMGNQPEFAVDPNGLIPGLAFQTAGGAGMGGFGDGRFAEGSLGNRAPWDDKNGLFGSFGGGGGTWSDYAYAKYIVVYAKWLEELELKRQNGADAKKDSPARNYEEESNALLAWVNYFSGGGDLGLNRQSVMAWLDPPPEYSWDPDFSFLANLDIWINNVGSRAGSKIANVFGNESSWQGKDGFKNKGWPTIKITVGVISTAFSAGALGFYMTSASATTIGTTIQSTQLGIGAYSTANDIIQQASPYSLPYSEKMNNVNAISNLYDAARFNPIGIIGIGMWYSDYKQNKR